MNTLRNHKRKPTHPGMIIREDILPHLKVTQRELAQSLGMSRHTVSGIIHEKRSVTAEMAIRISIALGGSPESWLRMQGALDLWKAQQKNRQAT